MMTALLSVGAWAENLWTGEATPNGWGFMLTESKSMSVGDILTFTITAEPTWGGITLKTVKQETNAETGDTYSAPDADIKTIPAKLGKVVCIVDDAIATAAADGLWLGGGNYTVTSVDYEKAVSVNLYTNAEGNAMNHWSMQLSSPNLLYAKTGDVLRVTLSAVGSNEYYRKLILQDAQGGPDAGNTLYTCENTSLTAGTLDIRLTDELIAKAQAGSLYIGGYEYTFTAVDLYLTSPTVSINAEAGYATFGYPAALDLTDVDAYTVSVSGTTATLTSVKGKKIPANTGIILKGTNGDAISLPLTTASTDEIGTNDLKVSDGTVTGRAGIYALAKRSDVVGFYLVDSSVTIPAGKVYLEISAGDGNSVKDFIGFGLGVETAISEVAKEPSSNSQWYNLAGQRVQRPIRGIYIQNGKKVIVK